MISETVLQAIESLALVWTAKINSKINQTNTKNPKYNNILPSTYIHIYTNEILTNKRCTHAQSSYTYTKLKAWFMPSSQEMF